jgi:hypothetical protein
MGGTFHPKLSKPLRPIANKYREGKVKRTLKRELKVPEIAEMETNTFILLGVYSLLLISLISIVKKRLLNSLAQW